MGGGWVATEKMLHCHPRVNIASIHLTRYPGPSPGTQAHHPAFILYLSDTQCCSWAVRDLKGEHGLCEQLSLVELGKADRSCPELCICVLSGYCEVLTGCYFLPSAAVWAWSRGSQQGQLGKIKKLLEGSCRQETR